MLMKSNSSLVNGERYVVGVIHGKDGARSVPMYIPNEPLQIASFITLTKNAKYSVIKSSNDEILIEAQYGFVLSCSDQVYYKEELAPVLNPMQFDKSTHTPKLTVLDYGLMGEMPIPEYLDYLKAIFHVEL